VVGRRVAPNQLGLQTGTRNLPQQTTPDPLSANPSSPKASTHGGASLGGAHALVAGHGLVVQQGGLADGAAVLHLGGGHIADAVGDRRQNLGCLLGVGDLGAAVVKLQGELRIGRCGGACVAAGVVAVRGAGRGVSLGEGL